MEILICPESDPLKYNLLTSTSHEYILFDDANAWITISDYFNNNGFKDESQHRHHSYHPC